MSHNKLLNFCSMHNNQPHFMTVVYTWRPKDQKYKLFSLNNILLLFQFDQYNDCWCSSYLLYRSCFHNCLEYVISCFVLCGYRWIGEIDKYVLLSRDVWCQSMFGCRFIETAPQNTTLHIVGAGTMFQQTSGNFPGSLSRWKLITTHKHYATSIMKNSQVKPCRM